MRFKKTDYKATYSNSRVSYLEKLSKAQDDNAALPNIIDIILEPLKPRIFRPSGKVNLWWLLWNLAKVAGALKAAFEERANQRQIEKLQ